MSEEEQQSLAEHWVLDYAIDGLKPVDDFGASTDFEFAARIFTDRLGGLGVTDLREALVRLAVAEEVAFRPEGINSPPAGPLTEPDLRAAIRGEERRYQYRPTPTGGKRWERFARPNWARFTRSHVLFCDGAVHRGFVAAQERAITEELLHWQLLRYGCVALPGSVLAMQRRPWRLLGWKELPYGWHIDFHYQAIAEPQLPPEAAVFFRRSSNWYESPFRDKESR